MRGNAEMGGETMTACISNQQSAKRKSKILKLWLQHTRVMDGGS